MVRAWLRRASCLFFALFAHAVFGQVAVNSDLLRMYTFKTMKKGDSLEYEVSVEQDKGTWVVKCVAADDESVWIETNMAVDSPNIPAGTMMLYGIDRKTGAVFDAQCESRGQMVVFDIVPDPTVPSEQADSLPAEMSATSHGSDNQKVGSTVLPCTKVELTARFPSTKAADTKARVLIWVSDKVSLKYESWEASGWLAGVPDVKWKPRKPPVGGLVRAELEAWGIQEFKKKSTTSKIVIRLIKCAKDAKPDLYMRRVEKPKAETPEPEPQPEPEPEPGDDGQ